MIALVVLTLLGWHASRIAAGLNEWPASASFLSNWLSGAIPDPRVAERFFVWAHLVVVLTFLAYLPYSKHLHIATAAVNVYFGRTRRRGRLEPLRFDVPDDEMRFGVGDGRRSDLEGDGRLVLVHRVWALPGRLPGVRDREDALAEAPDHGHPRPVARRGARTCSPAES